MQVFEDGQEQIFGIGQHFPDGLIDSLLLGQPKWLIPNERLLKLVLEVPFEVPRLHDPSLTI